MKNGFIKDYATIGILAKVEVLPNRKSVTVKTEHIDLSNRKENQSQLERIYELLECRTIDIIRNSDNDIYVDDEGLFVSNTPVIQLIIDNRPLQIAGTFLFSAGVDAEGDTLWFSKDSISDLTRIKNIEKRVKEAILLGFTE